MALPLGSPPGDPGRACGWRRRTVNGVEPSVLVAGDVAEGAFELDASVDGVYPAFRTIGAGHAATY